MHCWARYLFFALIATLGVGQMMAACGQKGDLFLPEPEPGPTEETAAPPEEVPAPAEPSAAQGQ